MIWSVYVYGAYIYDRGGESGVAQEGAGVPGALEVEVNEEVRGPGEIRSDMQCERRSMTRRKHMKHAPVSVEAGPESCMVVSVARRMRHSGLQSLSPRYVIPSMSSLETPSLLAIKRSLFQDCLRASDLHASRMYTRLRT